jgi:pyruvate/2-oxoglutarate/acetoin dehydrogenase E1 component
MKYREVMAHALAEALQKDPSTLILGEGVADPKGIFGTTLEAHKRFPDRVIEIPLSENMISGACLGMALEGLKPILVHARCELIMPAMEHMVNTLPKWRTIHRGKEIPVVIRALVGRGWGQGPNHSQALHAMFAQVPGLRVLYPVHPQGLTHWLNEALSCGWPTVIMEPRRLYELESIDYPIWEQPDIYFVTFGDVVLDASAAAQELSKVGVKAQVHPIEDVSAMAVPETNLPVVIADTGHTFCGASAEVAARLAEGGNSRIKRVGPPFVPLPTSWALEQEWYPTAQDIIAAANALLDISSPVPQTIGVDELEFKGPF